MLKSLRQCEFVLGGPELCLDLQGNASHESHETDCGPTFSQRMDGTFPMGWKLSLTCFLVTEGYCGFYQYSLNINF